MLYGNRIPMRRPVIAVCRQELVVVTPAVANLTIARSSATAIGVLRPNTGTCSVPDYSMTESLKTYLSFSLSINCSLVIEPEVSLTCSQEPSSSPCPEPEKSSPLKRQITYKIQKCINTKAINN